MDIILKSLKNLKVDNIPLISEIKYSDDKGFSEGELRLLMALRGLHDIHRSLRLRVGAFSKIDKDSFFAIDGILSFSQHISYKEYMEVLSQFVGESRTEFNPQQKILYRSWNELFEIYIIIKRKNLDTLVYLERKLLKHLEDVFSCTFKKSYRKIIKELY